LKQAKKISGKFDFSGLIEVPATYKIPNLREWVTLLWFQIGGLHRRKIASLLLRCVVQPALTTINRPYLFYAVRNKDTLNI